MITEVTEVEDSTFQELVLESDIPVLVDFWAEWCGPCKSIMHILDLVAVEYKDRIKVVKINVEDSQITAKAYHIRTLPTLIIFKNGVIESFNVGSLTYIQLKQLIDKSLK